MLDWFCESVENSVNVCFIDHHIFHENILTLDCFSYVHMCVEQFVHNTLMIIA